MKLYYSPGACSLASRIVLRETGTDFEAEKVDLRAKTTESGADFRAVNPKGQVPTLALDDGQVLTENAAILQYLGDRAGALVPEPAAFERYRLQEWLSFVGELHKAFGPLFHGPKGDAQDAARALIRGKLSFLEERLRGRDYLMGDAFTAADAYAFVVLRWTKRTKIDLDGFPNVRAYMERVEARPRVREALESEGLR